MKTALLVLFLFVVGVCVGNQCSSCGSECASACGTRRFRACCFNYLRRKRPDALEFLMPDVKEMRKEEQDRQQASHSKSFPEVASESKPYPYGDIAEYYLLNAYE